MYIGPNAEQLRSEIDTVMFDMDGVLIDISQSIRVVNCLVVPWYLREVLGWAAPDDLLTSEDIERFKNAGGFNDDWDLAYALVLHYLVKQHENGETEADTLNILPPSLTRFATRVQQKGGGLKAAEAICTEHYDWREREVIERSYDKPKIRQVFEELFAGDLCERLYGHTATIYIGPGYIQNDRSLLDLSLLPTTKALGIQTGRTYEEATVGRELCRLVDRIPDEMMITKRDGFHKPDPGGLAVLASRLEIKTAGVYIGDTIDDLRTVRNLNVKKTLPPVLSAMVLTGPAGKANEKLFRREGADIVAENVNDVLTWINGGG